MTSKEKKFIGILAGATVVCVGGLYFWASSGSARYDAAKEQFETVSGEIRQMENLAVYPNDKNKTEKQKALDEYKTAATDLATQLRKYRPTAITNTDPQTFTDTLVKVAGETFKAYEAAGLKAEEKGGLPKDFYFGFESYTSTPAQKDATGILAYQLGAISELHKSLAAAKPAELLNFYRAPLDEESNKAYTPVAGSSYRALPIEVAFSGPERSLREFINSLQNSKTHFYLIRSMRVMNEKQAAPKASDVQFDDNKPKPSAGGAAAGGGIFESGDAFVLPEETPAPTPAPAGGAPAPAAEEPKPAAEAKPADTSRILKQVLGDENVNAFFRIDIVLFDAAPETKGK